jgi:glycosyltransferase involved in cell wall biosynthesis
MRLVLLHYTAPPVVGGVEMVLAKQARQLIRAGHSVSVLAGRGAEWDRRIPVHILPRLDSLHPEVLKAKAELDRGVVPEDFPALVDEIEHDLDEALAGSQVVIAHNVASLHKNLALTVALHHISQKNSQPRLILWHHDLAWTAPRYLYEMHSGWPWDLLRTPWPGVRQVVVSQARQEELAELMGLPLDQITVISAGVDLHEFYSLNAETAELVDTLRLAEAAPLLLSPVRITRRKNLELGLQILKGLREVMPQAALVITGPPGAHNPANAEYLTQLQDLRASLRLKGAAHFLAERLPDGLSEESVAQLYRVADALLITSREEGFGIPILEAGLAGLPVFCTDLPSLHALAGDSAYYFPPQADPLAVAKAIAERLAPDPVYRLRRRVRSNYTWQAVYASQIAPLLEGP